MTDLAPAATLRAAAQALDDAANATTYEIRHGTYWHGLPAEEAWQRGITNAVGGPAGDFCALMSPSVAKATAAWLRATAKEMDTVVGTEYEAHGAACDFDSWQAALAVARELLGSPQ